MPVYCPLLSLYVVGVCSEWYSAVVNTVRWSAVPPLTSIPFSRRFHSCRAFATTPSNVVRSSVSAFRFASAFAALT